MAAGVRSFVRGSPLSLSCLAVSAAASLELLHCTHSLAHSLPCHFLELEWEQQFLSSFSFARDRSCRRTRRDERRRGRRGRHAAERERKQLLCLRARPTARRTSVRPPACLWCSAAPPCTTSHATRHLSSDSLTPEESLRIHLDGGPAPARAPQTGVPGCWYSMPPSHPKAIHVQKSEIEWENQFVKRVAPPNFVALFELNSGA